MKSDISQSILRSFERYVEHGCLPGGFLTAVLKNDLTEAVGAADDENAERLQAIVSYAYNCLPALAWGNADRVVAWILMDKEECDRRVAACQSWQRRPTTPEECVKRFGFIGEAAETHSNDSRAELLCACEAVLQMHERHPFHESRENFDSAKDILKVAIANAKREKR